MSQLPPCPQCSSEYTYEDGVQLVCPECGHEAHIFGHGGVAQEAERLGAPLLGSLPIDLDTRLAGDAGVPDGRGLPADCPWSRRGRRGLTSPVPTVPCETPVATAGIAWDGVPGSHGSSSACSNRARRFDKLDQVIPIITHNLAIFLKIRRVLSELALGESVPRCDNAAGPGLSATRRLNQHMV